MSSRDSPKAIGLTSVLEKQRAPRDSQVIHVEDEMDEKPCVANPGLHHSGKENLPLNPKLECQKNNSASVWLREVDQLKKQLVVEQRLRAQAEAQLSQQQETQTGEGEPRSDEEEVCKLREQVRMLRAKLLEFSDQRLRELELSEQEFRQLSRENESLRSALRTTDKEGCKLERLRHVEEDLNQKMAAVCKELDRLQRQTAKSEAKVSKSTGKPEEGGEKEGDAEQLLQQNAELLLTVQQLKQDAELLELENRTLRELTTTVEDERSRPTQHSQLLGQAHNNKQKARFTALLKEENAHLQRELKKVRNSLRQLQMSSRNENLVEALMPLAGLQPRLGGTANTATGAVPAVVDAENQPRTPCRSSRRRSVSAHSTCLRDDLSAATPSRATEGLQKRCREYERVLESLSIDFRHFLLLVERVLSAGGTLPGAVSVRGPGRQESVMAGKEDVSHLLRQLRDALARELQHSKAQPGSCTSTEG